MRTETSVDSFYQQIDDDRFVSTEHTIGPWSNDAHHAGHVGYGMQSLFITPR